MKLGSFDTWQIVAKVRLKFKAKHPMFSVSRIIIYHLTKNQMPSFYENILGPMLFRFPAETAHDFGLRVLKSGAGSDFAQTALRKRFGAVEFENLKRFGLSFSNPLGMAAGFDKNGQIVNQLSALGFGFVEVGTVTLEPQPGNPKPRMFRLQKDGALINRLGFNNDGTPTVVKRLKKIEPKCVLGVNIGKNKDVANEDAIENYLKSFDLAFEVADYVAVNVSSPNTPNLRDLQKADALEELLSALKQRNGELAESRETPVKPLLVKIAPDLSEADIEGIVDISLRLDISGIIATNTTIRRNGLYTHQEYLDDIGSGGLSGKPLARQSNKVIRQISKHSTGKLPVIGVGGVFSAGDAFDKIKAGACLIQSYTGFVYRGPGFARDINKGLIKLLKDRGFNDLDEAVGSESR